MLSFNGINDSYLREIYGSDLFLKIKSARESIFQTDILRAIFFCTTLILIFYLYHSTKIKKELAMGFVVIILSLDLLGIANRYVDNDSFVSFRKASSPFVKTKADVTIQQDTSRYRVFEPQLGLTGGRTSYFHNAIGGYHGAKPRRFEELFNTYNSKQNSRILDFLNIKYILLPDEENKELKPLINPNALGPVWFVSNLKEVDNPDDMIEKLNTTNFSDTALILKRDLTLNTDKLYVKDSLSKIKLVDAKPNYLKYRVNNNVRQFAVFSEMFYPNGWKANIDGVPSSIFNVNYVLRGLSIPANSTQIEFRFEPVVVKNGTIIRWASFIIFLVGITILGYFQYFKKTS